MSPVPSPLPNIRDQSFKSGTSPTNWNQPCSTGRRSPIPETVKMAIDLGPFTTAHLIGCAEVFVQAFAAPPWHEVWPVEHARIRLSYLLATPRAIGLVTLDPDNRPSG